MYFVDFECFGIRGRDRKVKLHRWKLGDFSEVNLDDFREKAEKIMSIALKNPQHGILKAYFFEKPEKDIVIWSPFDDRNKRLRVCSCEKCRG